MITKAIGGYFELELPMRQEYHNGALRLNSGKNCLEYILRARNYNKVYIPYYTCDVILRPFEKLHIDYVFYHINMSLELAQNICLREGEALLYTNYFGLKQTYVETLSLKFGSQLIVDNTQAFFAKPLKGIDTFYTCRKFFGVVDGAYLFTDAKLDVQLEQSTSYERVDHLIKRIDVSPEAGFKNYHESDEALAEEGIKLMSKFTLRVMQSIDYESVAKKRRENYLYLHEAIGKDNNLDMSLDDDAVPMVYPLLAPFKDLRERLIESRIFVARYWPNVLEWTKKDEIEYSLAYQMLPLPIDQRYDTEEMESLINNFKKYA